MIIRLSIPTRNRFANQLQAAYGGQVVEIRAGTMPAAVSDAPTGTLLVTLNLPATAFGTAATGTVALAGDWSSTGIGAGDATWARFRRTDDPGTSSTTAERLDVDVGMSGSGAFLILDNTNIAVGQPVEITAFNFTMPAS